MDFVKPTAEDQVVMLGDYVDRGPDSKGVIDYLIRWPWDANLITLKGNHELIMEEANNSPEHYLYWCNVGGADTLASYGGKLSQVPEAHWDFISQCEPYYETSDQIYVHGGVDYQMPIAEQNEEEMLWRRFPDAKKHSSGKYVVCGHTIQRAGIPVDVGHTVCIDTAACRDGWLTCLEAATKSYWQTNQTGKKRDGYVRTTNFSSVPGS